MIAGSPLILSFQCYSISQAKHWDTRDHKMADTATNYKNDPIDKAPHALVDAASVDNGVDGASDGQVDVKEEREFV